MFRMCTPVVWLPGREHQPGTASGQLMGGSALSTPRSFGQRPPQGPQKAKEARPGAGGSWQARRAGESCPSLGAPPPPLPHPPRPRPPPWPLSRPTPPAAGGWTRAGLSGSVGWRVAVTAGRPYSVVLTEGHAPGGRAVGGPTAEREVSGEEDREEPVDRGLSEQKLRKGGTGELGTRKSGDRNAGGPMGP